MFANPQYGSAGVIGVTYYTVFEVIGPIIEATGYLVFVGSLLAGAVSATFVIAFLALAIMAGMALSVASVVLEEFSFRRYSRPGDLAKLIVTAVIENFGYRQLSTWWRIKGIVSALRGDDSWGTLQRRGFAADGDTVRASTAPAGSPGSAGLLPRP
jgi:hypothetical protein